MKVLVTGATGNVGREVLCALQSLSHSLDIYAGIRDLNDDKTQRLYFNTKLVKFDFTNSTTYKKALTACDVLFLLRPPQISDVEKYFRPLIAIGKEQGVKHIVFLSVQGAEKSEIIPHHKIEKLIVESDIAYTFLRPAYFMQNFITTLRHDLVKNKRIFLPAGKAKFTLIDVRDIGRVAATILADVSQHVNQSYELTSNDKLTFAEMASSLSKCLGIHIKYSSPNLFRFFWIKKKEKLPTMLILVLIMLHYLPKFQKEPQTTRWVEKLSHKQPISFEQFITDYKEALTE